MRKKVFAPLIVLLMLVSVGGYMIMNNDGTEPIGDGTGEENNLIGDEWDVYYVQSGTDLPACGSSTLGRLYYIASTSGFETCTSSGWAFVDLTGLAGTDGTAGTDGSDGLNGSDGADGINGANGVNGTNGASGLNGTEGADGINGTNGVDIDPALVSQLQADNTALLNTVASLESDLVNATTCQLVPWGNCVNADLSGMNLSGMDLTGIDLRDANLQNTTFDNATLTGADLTSIVAFNATFRDAGLNETLLKHAEFNRYDYANCGGDCGSANLSGAYLQRADLTHAELVSADLTNADLRYADLTNADLGSADLTNADLRYADLIGADFYYADLTNADLGSADLTGAFLRDADLTNADLRSADLTGATLFAADLTNAYLRWADLTGANLYAADLTNANLWDADLKFADFSSATVTGTIWTGSYWHQTEWTNGVKYDSNQG
jgi:uncharacterized protein YjbI with pentapeptide repeats